MKKFNEFLIEKTDTKDEYIVKGKSPFYKNDHFLNTHETSKAHLIKKHIKHATRMSHDEALKHAKDWEKGYNPNQYKVSVVKINEEVISEAKDDGEYGQEGGMAKSQLRMLISSAKRLHTLLSDDDELPGHVIANLVLATDYVTSAADYMESEMADEEDFNTEEE